LDSLALFFGHQVVKICHKKDFDGDQYGLSIVVVANLEASILMMQAQGDCHGKIYKLMSHVGLLSN
jgi:hypothetical protein